MMDKKLTFGCLLISILAIFVNSCSVEKPAQSADVTPFASTKIQHIGTPTAVPTPTIVPTKISKPLFDKPTIPITAANAGEIVEIHRFGDGEYLDSLFTPDGKFLIVLTSVGLFFYDAKTLEQIDLISLGFSASQIAVNKGNTVLVAVGLSDEIAVIRLSDRRIINRIVVENAWGSIMSPVLSPDGNQVEVIVDLSDRGHQETFVGFYSTYNGTYLYQIDITFAPSSHDNSFSPDGNKFVIQRGNDLEIWDFPSGKILSKVTTQYDFRQCVFSPDGKLIECMDWRGHYEIFNVIDLSPYNVNFVSQDNFLMIQFSADGTSLWGCRSDDVIVNLDLKTGAIVHSTKVNVEIEDCEISPDEQTAAISSDGTIQSVYSLEDGLLLKELGNYSPTFEITGFLLPESQSFVFPYGCEVENMNLLTGEHSPWSVVKDQNARDFTISPDGLKFAYTTKNSIVVQEFSDPIDKKNIPSIEEKAFSWDGRFLAVAEGFTINVWDLEKSKVILTLPGHSYNISALAFSRDGQFLASGSWDETIKIWRLSDGTMIRSFLAHNNEISTIEFLPDGKTIISGSFNGPLMLWDFSTGEVLSSLDIHGIVSMDISPDSSLVATSSYDGTISISRTSDLQLIKELQGHAWGVDFVHFTSDGRMLISAADDGSIRVWGIP